jgi:hypothetical protein
VKVLQGRSTDDERYLRKRRCLTGSVSVGISYIGIMYVSASGVLHFAVMA